MSVAGTGANVAAGSAIPTGSSGQRAVGGGGGGGGGAGAIGDGFPHASGDALSCVVYGTMVRAMVGANAE